jgi:hypothetical protein
MLILKQNTAASVPTPAAGKGTIFLSDSDVLSVKKSSGAVESFPTVGGANTQVFFNDDSAISGDANFVFDKDTDVLTVTGNVAATRVLTDNLLYANGVAWDLQQPAGANTQVIFNDDGDFGADAIFTFNKDTDTLSVTNINTTVLSGSIASANGAQPNITSTGTLTALNVTGNLAAGNISTAGALAGLDLAMSGNAIITGNLTVNGTTTSVNVDSFDVEDPIIELGGGPNGAALSSNDGKDRGTILNYYTTESVEAFIGWDNSGSEIILAADVTNTNEVVTVNTYANVHGNVFIGSGAGLSALVAANIVGTVATATAATTAGTVTTNAQPNITSVGTLSSLASGASASASDFSGAAIIGAKDNTGENLGSRIGVVGEAAGDSTDQSITGIGVYGVGQANGATKGSGVYGIGAVTASADTGAAVGVRGITSATHVAGMNVGLYGKASGSSVNNYALYIAQGGIGSIENPVAWGLADNIDNALTFGSTGKANIFLIETTDNSEGIATTGYLNVTGNITATAGIKTDNYYYANGAPVDFQQPAGSNTQVIFNDDGDFGADSTFTFDKDTNILSATTVSATTVTATTLNGTLGTAAQSGITSLGTLSGLTVTNPIAGSITGTAASATGTAATVTTAAQPNITSTGTLTALTVTGNVGAGNVNGTGGVFTYVSGDGANLSAITGANVSGEVTFAATANTVAGANVTGEVTFAATANAVAGANVSGTVALATLAADATSANAVAGANVSGAVNFATTANAVAGANVSGETTFAATANAVAGANVSGQVNFAQTANAVAGANVSGTVPLASVSGTVSTAAQGNITSLGTLSSLGVNGTITASAITANTGVFTGDAGGLNNIIAGNITGTVATATTAGTVTTAAQPNITSVGTLSSVTTTGNVDTTANIVTDNIIGKSAGITITSIGTNQPVTLVPTGSGGVSVSSKRILDLAEPTASTDAATKQYVDDLAQGLAIQAPCKVGTPGTLASITSGTITYDNGTAGVGATLTTSSGTYNTIDGITVATNDRVLVKDEATTANNGIYVKTSATVLTRASDFDTPVEMAGGDFVFIQQGSTLNDTGFVMTDPVVTIGTDAATFVQFSGAGSFLAGAGLTLTGSTFSITDTAVTAQAYGNGTHNATFTVNGKGQMTAAANVQITAAAGALSGSVLNSSVTDSSLTSLGTIDTGVWQGTAIGAAYVATLNQNTTGSAASATTAGTVTTAAQPNITSVGTLSGLSVSATISGSVNGSAGSVAGQNVSGEVDFAQVANLVAGGNVSGTVASATSATSAGSVTSSATFNNSGSGVGSGTTYNGGTARTISYNTIGAPSTTGTNASGTWSINVTGSAGTAGSATTAGSTTQSVTFNNGGSGVGSGTSFNGGTARTVSYNTIGAPSTTGTNASGTWGINVSGSAGSAGSATTAGTVTTAAQPNITSVGTLSSLNVSGTTTTGTMQSTTITTGSSSTAGTITGDYTLTAGSTLNATYADLAEKYTADADYAPGTVLVFGGEAELSITSQVACQAVAGVVTTNPAQVYNASCVAGEGEFVVELALIGRVPVRVIGPVMKGDLIVTSEEAGFGCAGNLDTVKPGSIIGKALQSYNGETPEGVIEVLVGKN